MKPTFFFLFTLFIFVVSAQQKDVHIEQLKNNYSFREKVKCSLDIQVDVDGIHIPPKKIYVEFEKAKANVIKGEGLALMPKNGVVDQLFKILNAPFQAIFLGKEGELWVYKLVSLDQKSDWITADIKFDDLNYSIYESQVTTRNQGTFNVILSYHKFKNLPASSVISFEVDKFKIPLKFIGREEVGLGSGSFGNGGIGKIILKYTYL